MHSSGKTFSLHQFYADLQQYQANLSANKPNYCRREVTGNSMSRFSGNAGRLTPKNYLMKSNSPITSTTNLSKYKKNMQTTISRNPRPSFQKQSIHAEKNKENCNPINKIPTNLTKKIQISKLKEKLTELASLQDKQRDKYQPKHNTIKNEPHPQISQNISNTNSQTNIYHIYSRNQHDTKSTHPTPQNNLCSSSNQSRNQSKDLLNTESRDQHERREDEIEPEIVRILLNEIIKRDRVYEIVVGKVGDVGVEEKFEGLVDKYERMGKIIQEFKKMGKLDIHNDKKLYSFLVSDRIKQPKISAASYHKLTQ